MKFLRRLFGRTPCAHDWEVVAFMQVDEEFQYVVMEACTKCEAWLVHTP